MQLENRGSDLENRIKLNSPQVPPLRRRLARNAVGNLGIARPIAPWTCLRDRIRTTYRDNDRAHRRWPTNLFLILLGLWVLAPVIDVGLHKKLA